VAFLDQKKAYRSISALFFLKVLLALGLLRLAWEFDSIVTLVDKFSGSSETNSLPASILFNLIQSQITVDKP